MVVKDIPLERGSALEKHYRSNPTKLQAATKFNMSINMADAYKNFASLSDEEQELTRKFMNSPVRQIIRKIFGKDIDAMLGSFMLPISQRGKGLATKPAGQMYNPSEVE
tara:strand:+ start:253 stop:579 length:327 start_codon:yes stop_codon:yes gene_type:complete